MKKQQLKTTLYLALGIGGLSSLLGLFLSFILIKLKLFNSLDFFLNLPLSIQIIACVFYVFLWVLLFFVLHKELS
ncbi:hypothetical protein [Campylobacter helveticus]|uniref:hypothetical protein n=1 Tax=Campylobacter helveticus TaxID=28898 RepID=UPI00214A1C9B|nr:hypothetical protein [Campylobacter helveticus]MCR2062491.1 hypothetical protein [Campylobacter helveticus]